MATKTTLTLNELSIRALTPSVTYWYRLEPRPRQGETRLFIRGREVAREDLRAGVGEAVGRHLRAARRLEGRVVPVLPLGLRA